MNNFIMPHIRTKRKPTSKNLFRLFSYIALVFVLVYIIFSFGKLTNQDLSFAQGKNKWELDIEGSLMTKENNLIYIQIADTDKEKMEGLSGKTKLNFYNNKGKLETEGMLFVFEKNQVENFWMKDMNFDLDMLWLDENYKVVYIDKNVPVNSYNKEDPFLSKIYSNGEEHLAKYVLEINSGMTDILNIKEGDTLRMN